MKIGIAGVGRMGAAITARLIDRGHQVTVWNRTRAKAEPLTKMGASIAATAAELSTANDIIVSILTDGNAIAGAYDSPDGLLSGTIKGKVFVEMSTVRPEVVRSLAERVRAKGAVLVESPVGGSTGPAREGKLFAFVGGERADVARVQPILEDLCRRIEHLGPVGSGASVKLAINLPLLVYYQALGEALALAKPVGLTPERLIDIMSDTSGTPGMMKNRAPMFVKQLHGETFAPTVDILNICKDLRTMIEETRSRGGTAPAAQVALACYDEVIKAGLGAADCTKLSTYWHDQAPTG